jgi:hypothetical protein
MSQLLIYVAWIGVVILFITNLSIIFFTVIINQKYRLNAKNYQRAYEQIQPIIEEKIIDPSQLVEKLRFFKTNKEREVVFDTLMKYAQKPETAENSLWALGQLDFYDELMDNASKKLTLQHIQLFSQLRFHKAFPLLIKGTTNKNFEIKYNSFYAISSLPLSDKELPIYIDALLESAIMRDRIVDMLNHLHIDVEKILHFLSEVTLDKNKIILLLVLRNRLKKEDSLLGNQLLPYLEESREVRIATIRTLATSENDFYFSFFQELYKKEIDWQVRAVLAKDIPLLNAPGEQEILMEMVKDDNWWVRHNAINNLKKRYPNNVMLEDADQLTQLKIKESGTE